MMKNRKYGLAVGIFFIIATVAGITALSPLKEVEAMQNIVSLAGAAQTSGYLIMAMGIACASIAIWIYPVIKDLRPGLATAAVAFRGIEGGIFILSAIFLLPLGTSVVDASEAHLLYAIFDVCGNISAIAFCLGALMYYIAFWQLRVVPAWLSGWGIIAIAMHLVATVMTFGGMESFGVLGVTLNLPIALQEMVLAGWLIIKGFNSPNPSKEAIA
ncbi:MAG: DUF4386 domain-containing protein [Eubacteriales bacterium]